MNQSSCAPCSLESLEWTPDPRRFGMRVRGNDWRTTHRVEDGDLLVCRHGHPPRDGELVVVWRDGDPVLCRHQVDPQGAVRLDGAPVTDEPMIHGVVTHVVRVDP